MGDELEAQLSRWRGAGLVTPSQAEAIRSYEDLRAEEPVAEKSSPPVGEVDPPPPARRMPLTRSAPAFLLSGIDARTLGAILAALALLAMIGAVFALATDLVVAPAHRWATDVEDLLHAAAAGIGLTGGLRMAGGRCDGRRLVLVSLGLNLAATIVFSAQHLLEWTILAPVLIWMLLAWLTWNARFRDSAVATRSQLS